MIDLVKNLIFLYHVIVASENLLIVAANRSQGALRDYFRNHLKEELGHAEWLAQDLLSVGVNVKKTTLPVEALEMVGSVYYLIFHVDPVALLGYMWTLESKPTSLTEVAHLESIYGTALLRTLRYHAEHDPEHSKALHEMIEQQSPEQRALIAQVSIKTQLYIARAFSLMKEAA